MELGQKLAAEASASQTKTKIAKNSSFYGCFLHFAFQFLKIIRGPDFLGLGFSFSSHCVQSFFVCSDASSSMNHDFSSYFAAARSAKSSFPSKIGFSTPPPPLLRQRIQSDCLRSPAPTGTGIASERTQYVPLCSTPVPASSTQIAPRSTVTLPSAPQLQSLKLNPLLHACLKHGNHGLRGFQELLSSHAHFDPSAPENMEVVDFNQNFEAEERRGNFRYRIGHVSRAPVFLPAPKGFKRKSEVSESSKANVAPNRHVPSSPSIVTKLDSKFAKESVPKKVQCVIPAAELLEDVHCGICGDDEAEADDLIVLCDGPCGNAFHQQCFGIAQIPTGSSPFCFCVLFWYFKQIVYLNICLHQEIGFARVRVLVPDVWSSILFKANPKSIKLSPSQSPLTIRGLDYSSRLNRFVLFSFANLRSLQLIVIWCTRNRNDPSNFGLKSRKLSSVTMR
jgi:hypothetical protein